MTLRRARLAAALVAVATPQLAAAESHKLLVLQSEGKTDAATRTRIDAAIFKLARAAEPQAAAGELTYTDAATAVGCRPDSDRCKSEVLGMLGVDEIVTTTIVARPGGLEIEVRRSARGGSTRDARMLLATGAAPDKLDGIAPLFGESQVAEPPPAAHRASIPGGDTTSPPALLPGPTAAPPAPGAVPFEPPAPPALDGRTARQRYELAGMLGGGTMIALGVVLWARAASVQRDIDNAPATTRDDLAHLHDLESKGDLYAGVGNGLAIAGLVLGGVATYFYARDLRASRTAAARVMPTVLDRGAGLVLTFGATP